jgi:hypothetical protein
MAPKTLMKNFFFFLETIFLGCLIAWSFAESAVWKFGLIADSQWGTDSDHKNPNGVAADIITQVNAEFIRQGVKFVIAVGDLSDSTNTNDAMNARATYAQALYNAGIGFYPLRGNHDDYQLAATNLAKNFPQTSNGLNNDTSSYLFIATDSSNTHPGAKKGLPFSVGSDFSSPFPLLKGLTYGFKYNNATFILLDQFHLSDNSIIDVKNQQGWIDTVLSHRPGGTHAFVFGHKGIANEYHPDNLFGASVGADGASENTFITHLANNNVHYLIGGHDHIHNRSRVTTTNTTTFIQEIILASDSYKFYKPAPSPPGGSRETPISQDLYKIGYYIATVDDQSVTIDYYAVPSGLSDVGQISTTPGLTGNWQKMESFGYSLIGKEFAVKKDSSYSKIVDTFSGTIAAILGGKDTCKSKDGSNRYFTQVVGTGWKNASVAMLPSVSSNLLTLWGMAAMPGSPRTPPFALSMTYFSEAPLDSLAWGILCLMARDSIGGAWSRAVDNNSGGKKNYVVRPYAQTDTLGNYGIDMVNNRVWAVVNHGRDFAIGSCGLVRPPIPVSPFNGAVNQPVEVLLKWLFISNATSYRVQLSTLSDFSTILINDSLTDTVKQVMLSSNTAYFWRIRAMNPVGVGSWSPTFQFSTAVPIPAPPGLIWPDHGAYGQPLSPTFLWHRSVGAVSYGFQLSTERSFGATVISVSLTDTTQSIVPVVLLTNTKYFWQVNSTNPGGASAWTIDSFTTIPAVPPPVLSIIPLTPGWNLISLNIHPQDSTPEFIFSPLKGFVLTKNNNGQLFWPAYSLNTMGTLHTGQGYKVYLDSIDTIRALGIPIEVTSTPIFLTSGWNMIAYLPNSNIPITVALSGITPQITIVKNNSGQIYWPDFSINTIGDMKPGEGYKISMKAPSVLTYPPPGLPKQIATTRTMIDFPVPQHFLLGNKTGGNATFRASRVTIGGALVADGSEIGAFTNANEIVGAGSVFSGKSVFPIWGGDPLRKEHNGCEPGEKILFRIWTNGKEYPADVQTPTDIRYKEDAIFAGLISVPDKYALSKFDVTDISPNPFRRFIKISFDVPMQIANDAQEVTINLYSVQGKFIGQIADGRFPPGRQSVLWDGIDAERLAPCSNLFIIRMKAGNFDKKTLLFRIR